MIYAILVLTNAATLLGLVFSIKRLLISLEKIDDLTSQVEESLDIIDSTYASISKFLNTPVLFDDPVVVGMVNDVKKAKKALLLVANKLANPLVDSQKDIDG